MGMRVLVGVIVVALLAPACSHEKFTTSASDGGAVATRDVTVEVDWPSSTALDPYADARTAAMRVVVTDATDPSRTATQKPAKPSRGPFVFPAFTTGSLLDVTIELRGADDRLLGYGEQRRWDLAKSTTVPVAARERILYFISNDRGPGTLRAFDLAPNAMAEPGMQELAPPLDSLASPTGLLVTPDGRLLAEAGQALLADGGGGGGAVAVFETGTHARTRSIDLPFAPGAMVSLGGTRALVAPALTAQTTTLAAVDLATGDVKPVATGLQGGALDVRSMGSSADLTHVAIAARYVQANTTTPALLVYDDGAEDKHVTQVEVSDLSGVSGARYADDGTLVVGGYDSASTGQVRVLDASLKLLATTTMTAGETAVANLLLHPAGFAYVGLDEQFTGSSSCCGDLRIVDLHQKKEIYAAGMSAGGPNYDLLSAVRFPYEPHRIFAGQSDNGNNVHGAFVDMTDPGSAPVEIKYMQNDDIGSAVELATPFGKRL